MDPAAAIAGVQKVSDLVCSAASAAVQEDVVARLSWRELGSMVGGLAQDAQTPHRIPRLMALRAELETLGVSDLLSEIAATQGALEFAMARDFDSAYAQSSSIWHGRAMRYWAASSAAPTTK